jgi:hypothetical protein
VRDNCLKGTGEHADKRLPRHCYAQSTRTGPIGEYAPDGTVNGVGQS